jgi:hypothetical protein
MASFGGGPRVQVTKGSKSVESTEFPQDLKQAAE